jgi:Subtilase family
MHSRPVIPSGSRSQFLMIRARLILPAFAMLAMAPGAAHCAAREAALRFPVIDESRGFTSGPAYASDRLELRVTPQAANAMSRRAIRVSATQRPRWTTLGIAGVDHVAQSLGAWFEPEFAGETPPPPGSAGADFTTFYIVHLPANIPLESALRQFGAAAGAASVSPIGIVPVEAVPNDSLWSTAYWFDQLSGHDIHAPAAWDVTTGDTSIVVAVLDTGVLPYHPDLGGTVAGLPGQLWTNWAERGGVTFVDDDGNGFVDDTWGWDFVAQGDLSDVVAGEDGLDQDNDPNDFSGHGTFVAGLIGASTNNAIGVSGTAWNVRLMSVRVGWSALSDPAGKVDMSYVAQGIRYATRMGASVINCSFATLDEAGVVAATQAAERAGVTIVFAAGNSGQSQDVGMLDQVIAVAATDSVDKLAVFTNLGDYVDLCAPGVHITSTYVAHVGSDSLGMRQPAYLSMFSGTSFSAPLVSGAVALLQAQQKSIGRPPLWPTAALLRVRETADDISAANPGLSGFGTGRLNLFRALTDPPGSIAREGAAANIGPPAVLPTTSGRANLVYATSDAKLFFADALTGDTLALVNLPGVPARQLAGADLGGGHGVGLFIGTMNGKVAGFDRNGAPLPGWPKSAGGLFSHMLGGPALGDIDGDGVLEIVCGSSNGNVYAWHYDGTPVAGFPVFLDGAGVTQPIALAPLDTLPGVEIVAVTDGGDVDVISGDGSEPAGWPVSLGVPSEPPAVGRLGSSASPAIVIAAGTQIMALNPDGTTRWSTPLGGSAISAPAIADLDGDGHDEVIAASGSPAAVAVFDSSGVPWTSRGFPVALGAAPTGAPIVGPLRSDGRAAVMLFASGLFAISDSATFVARFPEPGGAGESPSLLHLLGDDRTRIAAGCGSDTAFYVYDAGAGTYAAGGSTWPAPRANDARTGTRLYVPSLPPIDDTPPSTITNLAAGWTVPDSVVLTWTAPGDNGNVGRAMRYELRVTSVRTAATDFSVGFRTDLAAPDSSGTPQRFALHVTAPMTPLFFSIRARDAAGNVGAPSNVAALLTPVGGPTAITTLTLANAADSAVTLKWTPPATPVTAYELRGARAPLDSAAFANAPLRFRFVARAGNVDSVSVAHLDPGTSWWFALAPIAPNGAMGPRSNVVAVTVPVGGALRGRAGTALAVRGQPARRPVRLDWQGETGSTPARIEIFDLSGRRLHVIALEAGRYGGSVQWNGRDDDERSVPAGLYFARLTCGSFHAQTRVVLLP